MKYPKPGYNNPLVSVHVFDLERYESALGVPAASATLELDWLGRHPKENSIISEVAWVGNSTLIVKEVNRAADDGNVVLFDIDIADDTRRSMGRVVRKKGKAGEEGDDGWIESVRITSYASCSHCSGYSLVQLVSNDLSSATGYFRRAKFFLGISGHHSNGRWV